MIKVFFMVETTRPKLVDAKLHDGAQRAGL